MKKTFKFRIFPGRKQVTLLNETLNECCWLYNHFLEERKNGWEKEKKSFTYYTQINSIPELKKKRPSLKSVYSQVLQNVAIRIDLAFKAFFRRVKAGEKKVGYPRFKGKGWYDSLAYPQSGFKITNEGLQLSKIGTIKIKLHRSIMGTLKTCIIRRQAGKWYVCFACKIEHEPLPKSNEAIGVDVGIKSFATLSNGEKVENPHFFKTDEKALAKAQRKLAKQTKRIPEREKAKKVVARIHERVANRRNNFCHQEARKLVNRFSIICIEDLNINQMQQGNFRSINRSISDVAWGQFAQYLSYKAENAGRQVIKVNPAYTSQDCSRCGYRQIKKLSDRVHRCSSCGLVIDRDENAALNILSLGLQILGIQSVEAPEFIRGE